MADPQKTTQLPEDLAPAPTDILYSVENPLGIPSSKKVSYANLWKAAYLTATEKTVSAGVLTVDQNSHKIQPETGTADAIDTISGMVANTTMLLWASDRGTDFLTFKHGTGNISCFGGLDIELSEGMVICHYDGTTVYVAGGGSGVDIVNDLSPQLGGQLDVNGFAIGDGVLELLTFSEIGSAVNHLNIQNAATGNAPRLAAVGDDANVDLLLAAKGVGVIKPESNFDGDGKELFGFDGAINAQVGTTYTTVLSDNGKVITLNNASAITLTILSTAPAGYNCLLIQKGIGQVTVAAGGTGILRNRSGHNKIAGQYGVATIFVESNAGTAPEVYFGGDTAL